MATSTGTAESDVPQLDDVVLRAFTEHLTEAERDALAQRVAIVVLRQRVRSLETEAAASTASLAHELQAQAARLQGALRAQEQRLCKVPQLHRSVARSLRALTDLLQDAVALDDERPAAALPLSRSFDSREPPPAYQELPRARSMSHGEAEPLPGFTRRLSYTSPPASPTTTMTTDDDDAASDAGPETAGRAVFCPWFAVRLLTLPAGATGFTVARHVNPTYPYVARLQSKAVARCGLRPGDVLLEVNGTTVVTMATTELSSLLGSAAPVTILVTSTAAYENACRRNPHFVFTRPTDAPAVHKTVVLRRNGSGTVGMAVGLSGLWGAQVTSVEEHSLAALAGVQVGDVVTGINHLQGERLDLSVVVSALRQPGKVSLVLRAEPHLDASPATAHLC